MLDAAPEGRYLAGFYMPPLSSQGSCSVCVDVEQKVLSHGSLPAEDENSVILTVAVHCSLCKCGTFKQLEAVRCLVRC